MTTIKVTKMQGCGNDFAVIDFDQYKKQIFLWMNLQKKSATDTSE